MEIAFARESVLSARFLTAQGSGLVLLRLRTLRAMAKGGRTKKRVGDGWVEEDKREITHNAPGGAPPNRISSREVIVSCAGHPSCVETGAGSGEEEKGKGKAVW